jgi:cell division protein ZapA
LNQLEVQIMGQSYLLGCPEGGEDKLRAAVQRVDDAMCKIRDAGKVRARDRIAVLAALNLAFDLSERPGAAADGHAPTESESEALRALLDRLDDALSEDGQLL